MISGRSVHVAKLSLSSDDEGTTPTTFRATASRCADGSYASCCDFSLHRLDTFPSLITAFGVGDSGMLAGRSSPNVQEHLAM